MGIAIGRDVRIDKRAGSQELIEPLRSRGLPVEEALLDTGDVEIIGNGPDGPEPVLCEYKKLGDLFQCMRDGRFADQLRKMREVSRFNWLLLEGRMDGFERGETVRVRNHRTGKWREADARITYAEVASWCLTMAARAGVLFWRTGTQDESVAWLQSFHQWWTAKDWEAHRSHMDFYTPPPTVVNPFAEPSLVQKVATVLPRIGGTKALRVAERFDTVIDMVNASQAEWIELKGVGKVDAGTIRRALGHRD